MCATIPIRPHDPEIMGDDYKLTKANSLIKNPDSWAVAMVLILFGTSGDGATFLRRALGILEGDLISMCTLDNHITIAHVLIYAAQYLSEETLAIGRVLIKAAKKKRKRSGRVKKIAP